MQISQELLKAKRELAKWAWVAPQLVDLFTPAAWLHRFLSGIAVVETTDGKQHIDLMLTMPLPIGFEVAIRAAWGGVELSFTVTGAFRFAQSPDTVGCPVSMEGHSGGMVGLFVKDPQNNSYALTCRHVLDEDPHAQPVSVNGEVGAGFLAAAPVISTAGWFNYASPAPNEIDGALVQLASPGQNTVPGGGKVTPWAEYAPGDAIRNAIPGGKEGTIRSRAADIVVQYAAKGSTAYFHNLVLVGTSDGSPFAVKGDSGSLAVREGTNAAVGIVVAVSDGKTLNNANNPISGVSVALCDVNKMLTTLSNLLPGKPPLTY
jgi:hypothetical protein